MGINEPPLLFHSGLPSLELRPRVSVVADWVKHLTQKAVPTAIIPAPFGPWALGHEHPPKKQGSGWLTLGLDWSAK